MIVPDEKPPTLAVIDELLADPASTVSRLFLAVDGRSVLTNADTFFANPDLLAMELPAANATGTARSIATLYGALARGGSHDDGRLLSPDTIALFTAERIGGPEFSTGLEKRWALGFALQVPPLPGLQREWGPHQDAFGHNGYGGQIGFADPVSRVGVGFLRNHLSWDSPLGGLLVDAVYECLPQGATQPSDEPSNTAAEQPAGCARSHQVWPQGMQQMPCGREAVSRVKAHAGGLAKI